MVEVKRISTGIVEKILSIKSMEDKTNMDLVPDVCDQYFAYCYANEIVPTIEGLCLALGIDNKTFHMWAEKDDLIGETLRNARQRIVAILEQLAVTGNISVALFVFLMKNYVGYTDGDEQIGGDSHERDCQT